MYNGRSRKVLAFQSMSMTMVMAMATLLLGVLLCTNVASMSIDRLAVDRNELATATDQPEQQQEPEAQSVDDNKMLPVPDGGEVQNMYMLVPEAVASQLGDGEQTQNTIEQKKELAADAANGETDMLMLESNDMPAVQLVELPSELQLSEIAKVQPVEAASAFDPLIINEEEPVKLEEIKVDTMEETADKALPELESAEPLQQGSQEAQLENLAEAAEKVTEPAKTEAEQQLDETEIETEVLADKQLEPEIETATATAALEQTQKLADEAELLDSGVDATNTLSAEAVPSAEKEIKDAVDEEQATAAEAEAEPPKEPEAQLAASAEQSAANASEVKSEELVESIVEANEQQETNNAVDTATEASWMGELAAVLEEGLTGSTESLPAADLQEPEPSKTEDTKTETAEQLFEYEPIQAIEVEEEQQPAITEPTLSESSVEAEKLPAEQEQEQLPAAAEIDASKEAVQPLEVNEAAEEILVQPIEEETAAEAAAVVASPVVSADEISDEASNEPDIKVDAVNEQNSEPPAYEAAESQPEPAISEAVAAEAAASVETVVPAETAAPADTAAPAETAEAAIFPDLSSDSVLNYVNSTKVESSDIDEPPVDSEAPFNAQLRRYDGAQVWRIVVQTDRDKKLADELQTKYDGQLWKEVKQEVDYLLKPQMLAAAESHIRAANLSRIVLIDNLQQVIEVENPPAEKIAELQNRKGHRLTWQAYHRLEDIHGFMDYMANTYPDICSVETIGYSVEKRPLKILKISNGKAGNPGIWMDGGMHAREWISPATVTFIANQLIESWEDLPEHMRNINYYIHPVANPDGYEYSHTTDRLWRKNMRAHGRQCPGVDLNRNFGYKWGGKGTSASPCSQTYRGSKAFSEPETFYISKYISGFPRDSFQAYLSFHSYGQYILYPWGYDYHLTQDRTDLDRVARQAGTTITKKTGVKYTVGSSATTLYPAAGGSDDWAKGIAGIKYAYTIEMGDTGRYGFVLPASFIQYNGKDGYTFVETVARAVARGKSSRRRAGV